MSGLESRSTTAPHAQPTFLAPLTLERVFNDAP